MSRNGPPPERWMLCPRKGALISELFIPFKVPLDSSFDEVVKEEHRFYPSMLTSSSLNIGMVIDLTKTSRYYKPHEFESKGIIYVKMPCEGRGSVPPPDIVAKFRQIVNQFVLDQPGKVVGVHCTHGYNRTGFLICAYLVEECGYHIEVAVNAFRKSREPGIYKQHYLEELYRLYQGDVKKINVPELPNWDAEDEEETENKRKLPGGDEEGEGAENSSKRPRISGQEPAENGSAVPNAAPPADNGPPKLGPIPGLDRPIAFQISSPKLEELRQVCQRMCGWKGKAEEFPGSQPVSLAKENLNLITRDSHLVSWKADGTRYMLLIYHGAAYITDRDFRIFHIPKLIFPRKRNPKEMLDNTLIDGELVLDKVEEKLPSGEIKTSTRPRYLMYDIVHLDGKPMPPNYRTRLDILRAEIFGPREHMKGQNIYDFSREPFGIRCKDFFDLPKIQEVFDLLSKLPHENDGLIFAPVHQPYKPGRDENLLKWKPPHLNTIDFKLDVKREEKDGMMGWVYRLLVQGDKFFGRLSFDESNKEKVKFFRSLDGKIVECGHKKGFWIYLRTRDDKSHPNAWSTAQNVMTSIYDGVTQEILMENLKPFLAPLPK